MIAAFDVHYFKNDCASAVSVLFSNYSDEEPALEYKQFLRSTSAYIPGEFYKRELPCILKLLEQINEPLEEMIVDGYVILGNNRPGLGQHLFNALGGKIPVIGVAKSWFKGFKGAEVFRGKSIKPLYITSVGTNLQEACEKIKTMHGNHRIPTLLKKVDLLARRKA